LLTLDFRLSLFLHGHGQEMADLGRSVNYNPMAAGRGPEFIPAGNGTAYVFETGCPSLGNRRTGELIVLHEAGP
jgi:hypothetical protein